MDFGFLLNTGVGARLGRGGGGGWGVSGDTGPAISKGGRKLGIGTVRCHSGAVSNAVRRPREPGGTVDEGGGGGGVGKYLNLNHKRPAADASTTGGVAGGVGGEPSKKRKTAGFGDFSGW